MAEDASNPGTVSPIRMSSAHSNLQGISAEYYNLTDVKGAPLAGLLVLMDRRDRPVRAEVHMNDTTTGALYEMALRQANLLITDRYRSDKPIRLYPLRVRLDHDPLSVELKAPSRDTGVPGWFFPVVGGVLALVLALAAGWFLNDWLRGASTGLALPGNPPAVAQPPANAGGETAGQSPAGDQAAAPGGSGNPGTDGGASEGRRFETNGLPPSRNAVPMEVGGRARLQPGYSTAIRSQAGAEAGEIIGYLQNADEMTLIDGPVWLQGNSDTIVWWYVRLDDGTEGWVPANTSDLTLLQPAP